MSVGSAKTRLLIPCGNRNEIFDWKNREQQRRMKHFIIKIQRDGNFFVAQCVEEQSCFTQGKTLQETIRNMREVLELMLDVRNPQLEVHLRHDAVEVFA